MTPRCLSRTRSRHDKRSTIVFYRNVSSHPHWTNPLSRSVISRQPVKKDSLPVTLDPGSTTGTLILLSVLSEDCILDVEPLTVILGHSGSPRSYLSASVPWTTGGSPLVLILPHFRFPLGKTPRPSGSSSTSTSLLRDGHSLLVLVHFTQFVFRRDPSGSRPRPVSRSRQTIKRKSNRVNCLSTIRKWYVIDNKRYGLVSSPLSVSLGEPRMKDAPSLSTIWSCAYFLP